MEQEDQQVNLTLQGHMFCSISWQNNNNRQLIIYRAAINKFKKKPENSSRNMQPSHFSKKKPTCNKTNWLCVTNKIMTKAYKLHTWSELFTNDIRKNRLLRRRCIWTIAAGARPVLMCRWCTKRNAASSFRRPSAQNFPIQRPLQCSARHF